MYIFRRFKQRSKRCVAGSNIFGDENENVYNEVLDVSSLPYTNVKSCENQINCNNSDDNKTSIYNEPIDAVVYDQPDIMNDEPWDVSPTTPYSVTDVDKMKDSKTMKETIIKDTSHYSDPDDICNGASYVNITTIKETATVSHIYDTIVGET